MWVKICALGTVFWLTILFWCDAGQILYWSQDKRNKNTCCVHLVDQEGILALLSPQKHPNCNANSWLSPIMCQHPHSPPSKWKQAPEMVAEWVFLQSTSTTRHSLLQTEKQGGGLSIYDTLFKNRKLFCEKISLEIV